MQCVCTRLINSDVCLDNAISMPPRTEHQELATTVTAFEIDQGAPYQGTTNHSARVV